MQFQTILKAAAQTTGTVEQRMNVLGKKFDRVPVEELAAALLIVDGITPAEYREIDNNGFVFAE